MTDADTQRTDAPSNEIPTEECYRLLRTQQVGRLGVNAEHDRSPSPSTTAWTTTRSSSEPPLARS